MRELSAFLGVSAAVICTPGQDTALTIRNLLANLANPKMVVFFTSLLPQFGDSFGTLLALGLTFSLLTFLWLAAYGAAVARARTLFDRARVRRTLDAVTGAVLGALGLRLAAAAR